MCEPRAMNMMRIIDYFKKPKSPSNRTHEIRIINLESAESENLDDQIFFHRCRRKIRRQEQKGVFWCVLGSQNL
uniref:Uncharacterized protein n=1 Tax=Romanomermis culicivorax TaxID=13658 RepID=A0A915JNS9_ROMCU